MEMIFENPINDEKGLILLAMTSKEQAMEILTEFIEQNQNSFYRLAYRYVHQQETAMDLVHDAIVSAISKLETLKEIQLLKPWFYRILVNECLGYLRKHKREILTDSVAESSTDSISQTDIAQNLDLYRAIDSLPPKLKTIIMLRFFEDMKLEEIAQITNTNCNTVKTRLYRALKLLRPLMQEQK